MELIEIVDEVGNKTGQIMEREKAHDLNLMHYEVGIFIINDKCEILLQKRSPNKRFSPNKWAICAGHVLAGESLEEATIREVKEEVGIDFKEADLHILEICEVHKRQTNSRITRFYYARCNKNENEFNIQVEELSEVKWFNIDTIIKMIKEKNSELVFGNDRLYLFERLKKEILKSE